MKTIRLIAAASAAFFIVGTAAAQNAGTVTNHAFPIGKGAGVTGYSSLLLANGAIPIGQTGADPLGIVPTGDVTISAGGVTAIGANKVTNSMVRQSGALSLLGRSANSTGNIADISATPGSSCVFLESSSALTCATIATANIANNAVTNAKMATMAAYTLKGNATGSTAAPTDIDITALTSKASPVSSDIILIQDSAAANAYKRTTVGAISSAGSVSSLNGQTGAVVAYFPPQGRLTLISGVSEMRSSQAGASTVYYTPHAGSMTLLYDGTNMVPTPFTQMSQATTDATKSPAAAAPSSCYNVYTWYDTGTLTLRTTRGFAWTNTSTPGANSALTTVNGIDLNSVAITNGPAAQRGTFVGGYCTNASSTVDFIFGALSSGGTAGNFQVWNAYNRLPVYSTSGDTSGTVRTQTTVAWEPALNLSTIRTNFFVAKVAEAVKGRYDGFAGTNAGTVAGVNVGLNTTSTPCGTGGAVTTGSFSTGPVSGSCLAYPVQGQNYLSGIEYNFSTTAIGWSSYGGAGAIITGLNTEIWQ